MLGLWVFLGGGTGAALRWALSSLMPAPWGTAGVNIVGSFLLAAMMHPAAGISEPWRLALGTGVLGGFTTYSTFNLDVLRAVQLEEWGAVCATLFVTLGGCLLAGAAGWAVSGRWFGVTG